MAKPLPVEPLYVRVKNIEESLSATVGLGEDVVNLQASYSDLVQLQIDLNKLIARVTKTETLESKVAANAASIQTVSETLASTDEAVASIQTTLTAEFTGSFGVLQAQIDEEKLVRADADGALASDISNLTATVGTNSADIAAEVIARADADSALASDISTLTSRVDDNEAGIINEAIARAAGDSANASSITTLSARVDDTESDLTVLNNAYVVGGVAVSHWAVTANANGVITGIEVTSESDGTAPVSEVRIQADKFSITNSDDTTANTPFEISGSDIVMRANVDIGLGDDQFVVNGNHATYGNTSSRHVKLEGYSVGYARLNLMAGTSRKVSIDVSDLGIGDFTGTINLWDNDNNEGLRLTGGLDNSGGVVSFGLSANISLYSAGVVDIGDAFADSIGVNMAPSASHKLAVAGTGIAMWARGGNAAALEAHRNTFGSRVGSHGVSYMYADYSIPSSPDPDDYPADGFGPALYFGHHDTGPLDTKYTYGLMRFVRNGANNTGKIQIHPYSSGSVASGINITPVHVEIEGSLEVTGDIYSSSTNGGTIISGGNSVSNGAHIQLYGGSHDTLASRAYHDGSLHYFRSQSGSTYATIYGSGIELTAGKGFRIDGNQVVGSRKAAIATPGVLPTYGGFDWSTDYTEVENDITALDTAVDAILTALRSHGLIAT